ncbi:MAG: aminopeptidase N [Actinomycetota bacterium]
MNNLTRDEALQRARLLSHLRYDVELDLTGAKSEPTFGSRSTIRFRCSQPGATTFVDFLPGGETQKTAGVQAMELNGRTLALDAHDGGRIHLEGLEADNELRVTARCAYQQTGVGLHRFVDPIDGEVYLYTQFEPFDAHRVFACFDQPDLKGGFSFSMSAPEGWRVISCGRSLEGAGGRFRFAPTPRISPYVTAVVAGPYQSVHHRHRAIDLGIFCRRSLARYLDPEELFEITAAGFDYYEESFEYPYPFGKYDQLFVPQFNFGAMENVGCVVFSERFLFRSKVTQAERMRRAEVILHEMAHMWFGDLVTMRWWDDLWLNESFATFMAFLALAEATRYRNAWVGFGHTEKTRAYRQDQMPTTHPVAGDIPDVEAALVSFDAITYSKGASALRQLAAWVGQPQFLAGVRAYFRRHEFANAELKDFLKALEEASGRNLQDWPDKWLETAGVNTLRPSFTVEAGPESEVLTSFEIHQAASPQRPTLRSHRVAIGLYRQQDGHLLLENSAELDVMGPVTPVPELDRVAAPDLLLINDRDLAYAKIRLDARSLATLSGSLGTLDDPLARSLCWQVLWDMLRDAEMPARRYLEIVLNHLGAETELVTLSSALAQAAAAAVVFSDPAQRASARRAVAETARKEMRAAADGSDHQLAWARAFISVAASRDQLAEIRGLLDGSQAMPGLEVDTELRWHMVKSLAAAGAADGYLIASELELDPSEAGHRHAETAWAARPTPEAKAAAWDAMMRHETMAELRATIAGFSRPDQEVLRQRYAKPYFDALRPLWERGQEMAVEELVRGAYPPASRTTITLTDEYLAAQAATAPGPIRRLLLEGRDEAERVLRARQVDAAAAHPGAGSPEGGRGTDPHD